MRLLAVVLIGSLAVSGTLATSVSAQTSVAVARGSGSKAVRLPSGGLTAVPRIRHRTAPTISPHIGLPGISGFPAPRSHRGFRHFGDRHHGRGFDAWYGSDVAFWGYGDGDGYANTIPMADEFGFFSDGEGVTQTESGPIYRYDRGYPYEWYNGPASGRLNADGGKAVHCSVRSVWDDEQRKDVMVRICRQN